jgi:hypothetical protein
VLKKDKERGSSVRTITLSPETHDALDKIRQKKRADLGLDDLSWNNFLSMIAKDLEKNGK